MPQEKRFALSGFPQDRHVLAALGVQHVSTAALHLAVNHLETQVKPRPRIVIPVAGCNQAVPSGCDYSFKHVYWELTLCREQWRSVELTMPSWAEMPATCDGHEVAR